MAARSSDKSSEGATLELAARRSCALQWRAFMEALPKAIAGHAGDEKALSILTEVGMLIAKEQAVPVCSTLAELNRAMNSSLAALDWGQVEIRDADRALELVVVGYPCFEGVEGQTAFAATLEGLLRGWLTMQGTKPGLDLRLVDKGRGSYPPLVFRYERRGSP
jgi:hypothetical protein